MLSSSSARDSDLDAPPTKMNHRRFRALLKKLRRKKIRQKAAQERAHLLEVEEEEGGQEEQEQEERERQHVLWLEREAEAQHKFELQRCLEQERAALLAERSNTVKATESLEQVLAQLPEASSLPPTPREESWHNPPAPRTYAPKEPCPFYLKTGACRFGDWCSRAHPRPAVSRTLLLRGLYSHLSLEQHHGDDSLETDERELQAHFEAFFWDVLQELRRAGTVCQVRVCRNLEPHLRGNVYVQYASEEEARQALTMLNGRWYAGRPVSCEFSPVDRWKTAVCGLFFRRACPKGRGCNFLHVFRNPTDECWHESRSPPPQHQRSHSPGAKKGRRSRSPHRSHKRSRSSRSRSRSKTRKKRRRHKSRSRSRSRSKKSPTHSSR